MKCCTVIFSGNTGSCVGLTNSYRLALANIRYKVRAWPGWDNVSRYFTVFFIQTLNGKRSSSATTKSNWRLQRRNCEILINISVSRRTSLI